MWYTNEYIYTWSRKEKERTREREGKKEKEGDKVLIYNISGERWTSVRRSSTIFWNGSSSQHPNFMSFPSILVLGGRKIIFDTCFKKMIFDRKLRKYFFSSFYNKKVKYLKNDCSQLSFEVYNLYLGSSKIADFRILDY